MLPSARLALALLIAASAAAQPPLDASTLLLKNVKAAAVTYEGRAAIRITDPNPDTADGMRLAVIPGAEFENGAIEIDVAGDTFPNAPASLRGFTGVAFRVDAGKPAYEAFYIRTKNGRSEDQEQRNHSAQYISYPDWPWQRLRQETPGRYESYVDLVPGKWTHLRIEVQGNQARLYVDRAGQPTLVVNDRKRGGSKGAVALWIGPGTVAHFANLEIAK
jgi:hypothetical protein